MSTLLSIYILVSAYHVLQNLMVSPSFQIRQPSFMEVKGMGAHTSLQQSDWESYLTAHGTHESKHYDVCISDPVQHRRDTHNRAGRQQTGDTWVFESILQGK